MPSVFEVLRELTPYDIDRAKVRIGGPADGAYVYADILSPPQTVLSFGIGRQISFDKRMATFGHKVLMFDHTIEAPPQMHEQFTFIRRGICGKGQSHRDLLTLDQHLTQCGIEDNNLILKMDVEGAEWDVFSGISAQTLSRFDHIAMEAHALKGLAEDKFRGKVFQALRKLNAQFTLFHVHANCNSGVALVDGFPVANLLELSFVRTSLVNRGPSKTLYPTPLDRQNVHRNPEIKLWFFPFLPTSVDMAQFSSDAVRLEFEFNYVKLLNDPKTLRERLERIEGSTKST